MANKVKRWQYLKLNYLLTGKYRKTVANSRRWSDVADIPTLEHGNEIKDKVFRFSPL